MPYQEDCIKNDLRYKDSVLYINGISLLDIASEYGTPLYVYSENKIKQNIKDYQTAFKDIEHIICYAVKANYNGYIIRLLASLGAGADVVSGGELYMAFAAGIEPNKIVFAGVGKTADEIRQAINRSICLINIESEQELEEVGKIAREEDKTAHIAFRINPDIDPKTHPKIATGLKENKFGIPADRVIELYEKASRMKYICIRGIHLHIGSQIMEVEPFKLAVESAVGFVDELESMDIEIKYIDIGGGLGIGYGNTRAPSPCNIAEVIKGYFSGRSQILIIEPGRSIVGNAGCLLTKVNYIKKGEVKNFIVVDAGLNDLIRPAMYGAYHEIIPVKYSEETMVADVVGPVCESGDFIATDRKVKGAYRGNILAVCDTGAYGFSMSSNYNSRPRLAEVIVDEKGPRLIRRRETYQDLIETESYN